MRLISSHVTANENKFLPPSPRFTSVISDKERLFLQLKPPSLFPPPSLTVTFP